MKKNYLCLFCCLTLFFFSFLFVMPISAQSLSQNLSQIDVSSLSETQIRALMQQGQNNGLNDVQLVNVAEEHGLSKQQGKLLSARIQSLRNSTNSTGDAVQPVQTQRKLNFKPDSNLNAIDGGIFNSITPQVFGADLFRNNNLTFEPNLNLATPLNYILGPNDQLNINVFGHSQVNWKLNISPEGTINIPGIGILNVSGKTVEQATNLIRNRLIAGNYAIGHGTNVAVSLGNIRSIKVVMVGQLQRPGSYTLPSLATVFNALYAAGGPNENGSFREIEVIRNNRMIDRLDIYDFLLKGDQGKNISLQDQDIIRVPTYQVRVEMRGAVKIPALFEVLPGETLQDVIRFAGGFSNEAYTALINVSQISDYERKITDVAESDYKNYIPLRGDIYTVSRILDRYQNRVIINGAVFRPGVYELQKGLTVSALIKKAAGLKEDAFTGRGNIVRLNPDNTTQMIAFDIRDLLNNAAADIVLQREDIVNISSIFDLRDQYVVNIKGKVRHAGVYPYGNGISVEDLILKAGGFTDGGNPGRIEVARRISNTEPNANNDTVEKVFIINVDPKLKALNSDFKLQPYDIVYVYLFPGYERQRSVKIEGEVVYPGVYPIQEKNERISGLIARAGGLTSSANAAGGTLRRDNIAILGISKQNTDTATILNEQTARLNHVKAFYNDSTLINQQLRNNYIGINLPAILKQPGNDDDLIVEDEDVISIPKKQQIVRINGEVLYPSVAVYTPGKSFRGYILNAGGFSPDALRRGAYIVYPNGTVKGTGKFLFFNIHPKVKPGSEIYVPKHPQRRYLTSNEVVGLATGVASIAAIIFGIISLHK